MGVLNILLETKVGAKWRPQLPVEYQLFLHFIITRSGSRVNLQIIL